jgi:hypothetical protein
VFFLGVGAPLIVVAAALVGVAWRRFATRKGHGGT